MTGYSVSRCPVCGEGYASKRPEKARTAADRCVARHAEEEAKNVSASEMASYVLLALATMTLTFLLTPYVVLWVILWLLGASSALQ